ncbi:MAG TPA: electron transfer flavoprotein subunit beta/FixA family protein [candidate division Zixibacteria bacterium]|nr:electron transfer flavoprotein subunit beta/FixA family protein [candidate division Zixibacteria bacterium]
MKIVVCIKQVPATTAEKRYTADLRLDRTATDAVINPLDEYAIEQALRLQDAGVVESVAFLSMGPEQASEALRRALAMGGDEAYLVTDASLAGADEWATAKVLAAALDKLAPDVSLMGMASDDARGSLVPGAVAAMRGLPLLSYGAELSLADGTARIRRLSAAGYDILEAPLPVVATVTDQVGEPRYASLKGIMAAKRKPLETWSLGDIGLSAEVLKGAALTRVVEARPPETKPPTERIENVSAEEAAVKVADWLAARRLI